MPDASGRIPPVFIPELPWRRCHPPPFPLLSRYSLGMVELRRAARRRKR